MTTAPALNIGNSNLTHSMKGYEPFRRCNELSYPLTTSTYPSQSLSSTSSIMIPAYSQTSLAGPPSSYYSTPILSSYDDNETSRFHTQAELSSPEVTSFTLSRSSFNTKICVYITSLYELIRKPPSKLFLTFDLIKCPASIQKLAQKGIMCSYSVTSEVPKLTDSHWQGSKVSVFMIIESGDGNVNKVDVGEIECTEMKAQNVTTVSLQENLKKRKFSLDHFGDMENLTKKKLRPKNEYNNYDYSQTEIPPPPFTYTQSPSSYTSVAQPQAYSIQTGTFHEQAFSRPPQFGYSSPRTVEPLIVNPPSLAKQWSSYLDINSKLTQGLGIFQGSTIHPPSHSATTSPPISANPPLFRTSTLQQSSNSANTSHCRHPSQPFNAYALYTNKAKLEIIGDLSSMARNWTRDEIDSRRRIVLFERSQSGSTITANFRSVRGDDQPKDSMCISCIYWEEKQECFVTSVDTIFLLQKLVAAQFTVEEKNRIRRNLEGFRPLTVSKTKLESEEFFKIIMAYPAPKPRNIEKDVKVFHWNDLCGALKKIIGKYSASPSSIVPPQASLLTSECSDLASGC